MDGNTLIPNDKDFDKSFQSGLCPFPKRKCKDCPERDDCTCDDYDESGLISIE
jgi:hypothetical protein